MTDPQSLADVIYHELTDLEARVGRAEHSVEERLRRLEDRALSDDAAARERTAVQDRLLKRFPLLVWSVGMVVSLVSLALNILR